MRAFTELWDRLTLERYGVTDPKARRFRYGVQVNSLGLTEAQPENNVPAHRARGARGDPVQAGPGPIAAAAGLERGAGPAPPVGPAVVAAHPAGAGLRDRPARVRRHPRRQPRGRGHAPPSWSRRPRPSSTTCWPWAAPSRPSTSSRAGWWRPTPSAPGASSRASRSWWGSTPSPRRRRRRWAARSNILKVDPGRPGRAHRRRAGLALRARQRRGQAVARRAAPGGRERRATSCRPPSTWPTPAAPPASGPGCCARCSASTGPRPGVAAAAGLGGLSTALRDTAERVKALPGGPPRFLVAKPGLDGHSNGAEQIAVAARDAGMEVIYQGIRLTPEQIAAVARDEDVDVIGLSILSGSHLELVPDVLRLVREAGSDAPVVVGGIIPDGRPAPPGGPGRRRGLHPQGLRAGPDHGRHRRHGRGPPPELSPRPVDRAGRTHRAGFAPNPGADSGLAGLNRAESRRWVSVDRRAVIGLVVGLLGLALGAAGRAVARRRARRDRRRHRAGRRRGRGPAGRPPAQRHRAGRRARGQGRRARGPGREGVRGPHRPRDQAGQPHPAHRRAPQLQRRRPDRRRHRACSARATSPSPSTPASPPPAASSSRWPSC